MQGIVEGAEVPLAHPEGQSYLLLRQHRLLIQQAADGLQGLGRHLLPQLKHHALGGAVAPPEGYRDPAAHGELHTGRHQIVVGLVNGVGSRRHSDLGDLRH